MRANGHMTGPQEPIRGLSLRDRQVLGLVAQGLSNKEIAVRLGIATPTVNQYVHNLLLKLAVANRTQLAVVAVRTDSALSQHADVHRAVN